MPPRPTIVGRLSATPEIPYGPSSPVETESTVRWSRRMASTMRTRPVATA